jgi:hypothetical protein
LGFARVQRCFGSFAPHGSFGSFASFAPVDAYRHYGLRLPLNRFRSFVAMRQSFRAFLGYFFFRPFFFYSYLVAFSQH